MPDDVKVLDHGYVRLIETWGSDERVIESARMSTGKGFLGWGPKQICSWCKAPEGDSGKCGVGGPHVYTDGHPGDEKLLRFLYENAHSTPFEMAGLVLEIQAPIFIFREWHRHRTQCLGPDTLVHFDSPKSRDNRRFVYKMRIEDIWKKWQPTKRAARPERQVNALWPRSRLQAMQLRCLHEEDREIGHSRIVDVIRGEPKAMLRVTTASGRSLTATPAHRVLTNEGWATLGEAVASKSLLTLEGTTRAKASRWDVPNATYAEEWRPIVGWESVYEVSNYGRVRRIGCEPKRLVVGGNEYDAVALNRSGEQATRTVHTLVLEAFVGPAGTGEVRHLDSNRANNHLDNLAWGTATENARDRVLADRQQRLVPTFENVVSVEDMGELPTFDLSVEGPWHNFIADGFVVHNSYSEMSARYTPLPDVNYVPTIDRLMMNASATNKQAGTVAGAASLDVASAEVFQLELRDSYEAAETLYRKALAAGVPKELARIHLPVGRYSRMRASANLRNWLGFLTLRMAPNAQWEIREYSNAVGGFIASAFPRTWELFAQPRAK